MDEEGNGASSLRMPSGELLRLFDLHREDPGRLIALKEAVYRRPVLHDAFAWEYLGHPRAKQLRVFVSESNGIIVAATTRLPSPLVIDGVTHPAYFNVESMVHPDHRRKGRMRELYMFARKQLPASSILLSKGSSDLIYPMLLSTGQRPLLPNTFMVSRPSTARWLLSKLHLRLPRTTPSPEPPPGFDELVHVTRFGGWFDAFFRRVADRYSAIFERDAAFMNWRYVDIPHRRYVAFRRVAGGETTSVVVLSMRGERGFITDIVWDPAREDEPHRTIRFSQKWLSDNGSVNASCFSTYPPLRAALAACGFVDRGQTPRFSGHVPPRHEATFGKVLALHVVDGDGDTEFS